MLTYEVIDPSFKKLIDTEREIEVISSGHIWTEGPVWLGGQLFFNDIPNKRMHVWSENSGVSVALENSEFANGNTLDLSGKMISCEHGGRRVIRRHGHTDSSSVDVIAESYNGKRLNSPNDVVVKSDGTIWFTDPPYGINSNAEGYAAESEICGSYVFRVDVDGVITPVVTDFDKPNGLAFSPDESKLYIADSGATRGSSFPDIDYTLPHHIRVFDVVENELQNSQVFVEIDAGVPDGFRVDTRGHVWTSALDGIRCLNADGVLLGKILLPEATANCCFGGGDGTDLFITSSSYVYRVRTACRGAETLRVDDK